MPDGMRKSPGQTFKIGKNPVAALVPELVQGPIKKDVIVHNASPRPYLGIKPTMWGSHVDPDQEAVQFEALGKPYSNCES